MEHIYQNKEFGQDWFTYPDLYKSMVEKFPSGSKFVEVGSWKGKSSSYMCVEIANSQKDIEFFCVDHFLGSVEHKGYEDLPQLYETFISNMKPVEKYYKVLKMTSTEAADTFEDASLDFVFIDAGHEYENVKSDIQAWLPKVKTGGVLAGHDISSSPVNEAVNEVLSEIKIGENRNDCWIYDVK